MDTDRADGVRKLINAAHAEALRVGDSPLRADRLAESIEKLKTAVAAADVGEERSARMMRNFDDALRVLRRDDDGREAARHLQAALKQVEAPSNRPSPFLDD